MSPKTAIVLFAHGSRDPEWARPFGEIKRRLENGVNARVELAFLEIMQPSLGTVAAELARSCTRILVAPLFMGHGPHLKRDLSRLIGELREKHSGIEFELLPPVGDMESVLDAISDSIARAASRTFTS